MNVFYNPESGIMRKSFDEKLNTIMEHNVLIEPSMVTYEQFVCAFNKFPIVNLQFECEKGCISVEGRIGDFIFQTSSSDYGISFEYNYKTTCSIDNSFFGFGAHGHLIFDPVTYT